jgi:predicted NBD/HSP70 family sugar kinase
MDYQARTQSNVKLKNQQIILQLLINEGSMTRADLAKKMRSSKPTISKNVEELIKDHKVIEAGKDDNLVGKKGVLLDINADYGYVLALDLSKNQFRAVLANLKEEWLATSRTSLDEYLLEGSEFEVDILQILKNFIKDSKVPQEKILQVTLSYSGVVGHNDELYLTNLKYKETLLNQLVPFVRNELMKPLLIKNDINLAALAEKKYGRFSDSENMYLLSADIGVGVGIIIHNELYEGDRNAAGEVGFVLPVQHRDGRYLTIEERVSLHTLAVRYRAIKGPKMKYENLSADVEAGDSEAIAIYEDVLEDLSVTITNIASIQKGAGTVEKYYKRQSVLQR